MKKLIELIKAPFIALKKNWLTVSILMYAAIFFRDIQRQDYQAIIIFGILIAVFIALKMLFKKGGK